MADKDDIVTAVNALVSEVHDIAFHHTADGTWQPWPDDDSASLLNQGYGLLRQLGDALTKAYQDLAAIEENTRRHTTPDGGTQP
ncbi:MAG: hypothetical protein QOI21_27 [Actinomycetota bacterium]|jgi:hypothetical protein|nr:hypothetical protein [Actinomycetota bacterium]